jgi:hypothetical protein
VTSHASGKDTVGAIFDHNKQKVKRDKEPDGGFKPGVGVAEQERGASKPKRIHSIGFPAWTKIDPP